VITIPTSELLGLLTDVLAFSPVVKDDPRRGVLFEWDGENLHASAYDVLSAGRSTWMPGGGQEGEVNRTGNDAVPEDFRWGSDEPAWKAFVGFDDAKAIINAFKVAPKLWWIPLSVKISPTGGRLTIERSGEFGKPAALITVTSDAETTAKFPDVCDMWGTLQQDIETHEHDRIGSISFSPYRLAAFGTVRAHGVLDLEFAGEDGAVSASMGNRFVGFIYPAGASRAAATAVASASAGGDLLRHGTGVHVSTADQQDERYGGPASDVPVSTDRLILTPLDEPPMFD
jgi:hypothetical protein